MKQLVNSKNMYNIYNNLLISINKFISNKNMIKDKLLQNKKIKIECYLKSSNCKYDPIYDYCYSCNSSSNIKSFNHNFNKCF